MSTRSEKNKVCQSVIDWQNERQLKGWNPDQIKYEIGLLLTEDNKLILVDDSNLHEDTNIVVDFEEGKSGLYELHRDEDTGLYSISKSSSRKKKVEDEIENTEETEEETSEEEE